ncbi:hypothetical protein IGI04_001616 [Brassica rapa subsp. trilocularis]|uniref:Uncharacterized protein n=1 Tax=Brassica rapa subsp. trilocularis TaxID=1813537 RepID=A0ABQ7NT55_BRACM|nr:hypothetical protein IGI04_001616 [Brassica rapa subsp. trilocularis]
MASKSGTGVLLEHNKEKDNEKTSEASVSSSSQSISVSTLADQVSSTLSMAQSGGSKSSGEVKLNEHSDLAETGKRNTYRPSTSSDISDETILHLCSNDMLFSTVLHK